MIPFADIERSVEIVRRVVAPTPQICWPLLSERCGAEVWVKHENHTPLGAFKVRGGLTYMKALADSGAAVDGVISATRGNHGQSLAFAARQAGLAAVILVPHGNSPEKNAAMRAHGAELIEHGADFQAAYERAAELAGERNLHMVPSIHPWLLRGVGTYGLEFLGGCPELDTVYVPVGMGSSICALIIVRDGLRLATRIVGVVSEQAPMYALSFEAGKAVSTNSSETMADGVACRVPDEAALEIMLAGADRVITVSEAAIEAAMRHYFSDTHNVAEGAGAIALAGALTEPEAIAGTRIGLVLSGGNVDRDVYARVLAGG